MRGSICIDIDNVIAKTDEVMRSVIRAHSRRGVDLQYEDVVCFDYWLCRDSQGRRIDRNEWDLIHREFTFNYLSRISPVDGVQEYLQRLAKWFDVHLTTSRLPGVLSITIGPSSNCSRRTATAPNTCS